MESDINKLENRYNSSPRESARILELCDYDIDKLADLYFRMQLFYYFFKVVNSKEEVAELLSRPLTVLHKSGAKGCLQPQYYMHDNRKPIQYGCVWSKEKTKELGLTYFWQRRSNFKLTEKNYE